MTCYARWPETFGPSKIRPPPDEDPSEDQLSSLHYLISSGEVPYVDFAVWGPYQQRLLKRQTLVGLQLNEMGEVVQIEILGPATYTMWKSCWTILANSLLLLGALDLGNLVDYGLFFDRFHARHGERTYPLMYQADVRPRMELMGRTGQVEDDHFEK